MGDPLSGLFTVLPLAHSGLCFPGVYLNKDILLNLADYGSALIIMFFLSFLGTT